VRVLTNFLTEYLIHNSISNMRGNNYFESEKNTKNIIILRQSE